MSPVVAYTDPLLLPDIKSQVIVDMQQNACSVSDDGNIFQDLSAFDVPLNAESRKQSPGSKTFDIAFLADVIEALKSDCLTFHKQ